MSFCPISAQQEIAEKLGLADRKANALQGELEEARSLLDTADRGKKQADMELSDARSAVNEMTAINTKANADKRHLESAVHTMHAEIDDMLHQAKNSEEKAKKAMVDAARLADELRSEQDHANSQEKAKRALEAQISELDQRLAEANEIASVVAVTLLPSWNPGSVNWRLSSATPRPRLRRPTRLTRRLSAGSRSSSSSRMRITRTR